MSRTVGRDGNCKFTFDIFITDLLILKINKQINIFQDNMSFIYWSNLNDIDKSIFFNRKPMIDSLRVAKAFQRYFVCAFIYFFISVNFEKVIKKFPVKLYLYVRKL